ncbi:MAG: OmpA family protein [Lewinellaceae bacterium]|nr:OmpA family protein [Saprospiraceae bacterium]MCB9345209.1 OmpA family protein [Lewinellaceae bacterium]
MNSKPIILVSFAIWCFICTRWYVCGIKNVCGPSQATPDVIETPAIENDSSDSKLDTNSMSSAGDGKNTLLNHSKPVLQEDMNKVQMEAIADQMVIYFPYRSTRKEDNAAIDSYLSDLAKVLISSGEKVYINGHTDFVGESKVNYNFGLQRAYSLRDILVNKGVSKSQVICKSYGEKKPVATNDTPYGRYLNRRAELRVGK